MYKHGPVDVVVLAAGEPHFNGSVFKELEKQTKAGTIRVLDAMVLLKKKDGAVSRLDLRELPVDQAEAVKFMQNMNLRLFSAEDAEPIIEGMVPGSAVVALAIEHTWAVDLVNALKEAGVELAFNTRIPAPLVDEAFGSYNNQ